MEQLTLKKRLQVVYLYFSGLSSDQIATKTGVSKGSVANIVWYSYTWIVIAGAGATSVFWLLRKVTWARASMVIPIGCLESLRHLPFYVLIATKKLHGHILF